jgi:hypothetical protein
MARVIEKKRDAPTARVELLAEEGAMQDFLLAELSPFFTNIDLKKSEAKTEAQQRVVSFEIALSANYSI